MLHYRKAIGLFRILFDIAGIGIAFWIALHTRFGDFDNPIREIDILIFLVIAAVWLISARINGLYNEFRSRNFGFEVVTVIRQLIVLILSTIIILFLIKDDHYSRVFVISLASVLLIYQILIRLLFRILLIFWRLRGRNLRNMLIVGTGKIGQELGELVAQNPNFGYVVKGFVDDSCPDNFSENFLGNLDNLDRILSEMEIDIVIIALQNPNPNLLNKVIAICEFHTTRIKIVPDYFRFLSGKFSLSSFGKFPIISVRDDRINDTHWRFIKRTVDICLSFVIIMGIVSWTFPIISFLIKLNSHGSVLYKQERWGRDNKKFKVYKFRTMEQNAKDCDSKGRYQQAIKNDPRVTKVGRFLRKTSLDELPQFFNVLKGDMSIVGPRPHPTPLNEESKDKFHLYMYRHIVKPGITGWAQVNGFRGVTADPELMKKRIEHDIWYIENWSLWLDFQIIIITIFNMIKGEREAF